MAGVRWTGRRHAGGRRPMTARVRRGVAGVQTARGTVQGTHTRRVQGLGRGARPIERRPASTFVYDGHGGMPTRPGVSSTRDVARGALRGCSIQLSIVLPQITQNSST
jgi:hypothetical protein